MEGKTALTNALEMLGELLEHRGMQYDLAVVGGAALLLQEIIFRPTLDMDVVAMISSENRWHKAKPFPEDLVVAIRDVAETLDLPRYPRDDKDWLNPGPSMLMQMGLPQGFEERTIVKRYKGLTLRVASRSDLVCLKLWAATDTARGSRREVDIADLKKMAPTKTELASAIAWCAQKDGRRDFATSDAAAVINQLGFSVEEFDQ